MKLSVTRALRPGRCPGSGRVEDRENKTAHVSGRLVFAVFHASAPAAAAALKALGVTAFMRFMPFMVKSS